MFSILLKVYGFKWSICIIQKIVIKKLLFQYLFRKQYEKAHVKSTSSTCAAFSCPCYIIKSKLKLILIMMTYWKPYRDIHEGNKKVGEGGDIIKLINLHLLYHCFQLFFTFSK
jgi:hypothetical protein